MTGALWAKRGERDISRGARHEREERRGNIREDEGREGESTESVGSLLMAHTRRKTWRSIKERSDILVDFTGTDFSDPETGTVNTGR